MQSVQSIRLLLIVLTACVWAGGAWGQSRSRAPETLNCSVDQVVAFADGRKSCLSDIPGLAQLQPANEPTTLSEIARQQRTWSLWSTAAGGSCTAVLGFHHTARATKQDFGDQEGMRNTVATRAAAKDQCEARAGSSSCECVELATSGTSSLSRENFTRLLQDAIASAAGGGGVATGETARSSQAAGSSGALGLLGRLIPGATAPQPDSGRAEPARPSGSGCSVDQLITFPGGRNACLSDLVALAQLTPSGERITLSEIARQRRIWSLWASETPACTGAYGFAHVSTPVNNNDLVLQATEGVQITARQQCEAKVQGRACGCVEVVTTGTAAVSRTQFDVLAALVTGALAPPADAAASVQQFNSANRARPISGASAPLTPARPDSETEQLRKELAALRQELAAGNKARASADIRTHTESAGKPRVRALVIGNGNYRHFGRLANPVNDARAMAAKLSSFGIDVQTVFDADRDSFIRALNTYAERSRPGDIGILFYAGHGVQVDGINYLVPINMQADGVSAGYIKLSGISLNDVIGYMPATTRLIFLDACRDNPATRALVAARSTSVGIGLAPVNTATGTLISYATRDGGVAEDGKGANSPYTSALLRHLDARQDIALVLRQVRQTVMRMTGDRQQPWEYGSLVGDQLILSQVARP